jgi:hypothetical protein
MSPYLRPGLSSGFYPAGFAAINIYAFPVVKHVPQEIISGR